MIAGTLEIQMAANLVKLQQDMNSAKNMVSGAMKSIESSVALAKTAMAALGVGLSIDYFKNMINGSIDVLDHLNDLSKATRISVEDLAGLKLAAKQSGSDLDSLAAAINKLGTNMGKEPEKFKALGITAKDNMTALMQLSDLFIKLEDDQLRNATMAKALGKSWQGMAPLLSEGSAKIKEMIEKGRELSKVTTQNAQDADELKDKMAELSVSLESGSKKLAVSMMPALTNITNAMAEAAKETNGATAILVGFGGVLSWLFGLSDGQKTVARLKEINEQIKVMEGQLKSGTLNPEGKTGGFWSFLIPDEKFSPESLAKLAANLAKLKKERDAMLPPPPGAKPAGPTAQEIADAKAKAEKFLMDQKAAENALEALRESRAQRALEAAKDSAAFQLQQLEYLHDQSLVSDQDYYQRKLNIARDEASEEMKVLDLLLAAQKKALGEAKPETAEYYKALKDVEETQSKQAKVVREFGQAAELSYMQATKAAQDYKRSIEGINIQILQLTGETAKAAAAQFELSNRDLRKRAVANGDEAGVAAIDRLGQLTVAQASFNEQREKLNEMNARLAIEEERIQNSQRTGAVSELEALSRTGAARADSIKQQEAIIENLQRIAKESQNPALILQAEQARAAMEKLRSEADLLGQKFETIFTTAAGEEFANFISGTKSAKQAFNDFTNSVLQAINRMVAEALAKRFFETITGGNNSGGGGFGSLIAALFGGGGAAAPVADSIAGGTFAEALAAGVIPMASGGDFLVTRPTLFLAGEAGVERASFSGGGNSGGRSVNVTNNFYTQGPVDRRTQQQMAASAGEGIQRALGRNS